MPETKALYPLWPRQQEAMRLLGVGGYVTEQPVEELLFGGQAGGGKSRMLRALGVGLCLTYPGLVIPIFRRTYPELDETMVRKILEELPEQAGKYNADRHEWRFPNKSVLEFRYCERENDVYAYNSAEWDALFIDEATQFSESQVRYLRSRVRSTRTDWRPIIVYTANPGGVGHTYFKKGFVDAAPPGTPFRAPLDDGGAIRAFLPARLEDNPALSADYKRKLEGIADPMLRKALRDGNWNIFAGQVFSEFDPTVHVVDPFPIPIDWKRWRAYDYGFSAPMCCLWLARDPRTKRVYVYRELYGTEMRDTVQAQMIKTLSKNEKIDYMVADPALWNRNPNGESIATVFAGKGIPMQKASNDRLSGWQRVHEYLAGDPPFLQIFATCTNLIRTLPNLEYDKHRVEDVDSSGDDHAGDALRYALMSNAVQKHMRIVVQDFQVVA